MLFGIVQQAYNPEASYGPVEIETQEIEREVGDSNDGGVDHHTGHSSSVGVPSALNIVLSWSMSLSPGRYGILSINSASIHPTDHISTAVL